MTSLKTRSQNLAKSAIKAAAQAATCLAEEDYQSAQKFIQESFYYSGQCNLLTTQLIKEASAE